MLFTILNGRFTPVENYINSLRIDIFKENTGFVNGFSYTKIKGNITVGNYITASGESFSGSYWYMLRINKDFYSLYKGLGMKLYMDYTSSSTLTPSFMSYSSTMTSYDYNGQPVRALSKASNNSRVIGSVDIDPLFTDSTKPYLLLRNNRDGSNITDYIYNIYLSSQ